MLDAFIIERIRQQRHEATREPLRVEIPLRQVPEDLDPGQETEPEEPQRGVVIIDDTV
jgi:hypothetical protein